VAHGRRGLSAPAAWPQGLTTVWPPRDRSQRVPPQQDASLDNRLLIAAQVAPRPLFVTCSRIALCLIARCRSRRCSLDSRRLRRIWRNGKALFRHLLLQIGGANIENPPPPSLAPDRAPPCCGGASRHAFRRRATTKKAASRRDPQRAGASNQNEETPPLASLYIARSAR